MDLKTLEEERDKEITGFFWLGLQIAFIFGIPAFLAVWIGKIIAKKIGVNNVVTISLLISFIVSWIIVFYFYQKKAKKIKKIEDEIRRIKNEKK